MSDICKCLSCGWEWKRGLDGSHSCSEVLRKKVQTLQNELDRYSMSAGMADKYKSEAMACREALGFESDDENVSPSDLVQAIHEAAWSG